MGEGLVTELTLPAKKKRKSNEGLAQDFVGGEAEDEADLAEEAAVEEGFGVFAGFGDFHGFVVALVGGFVFQIRVGLLDEAAEDASEEVGVRVSRGGGVAGCGLLGEELVGALDPLPEEAGV
jgi:hypothetical protein